MRDRVRSRESGFELLRLVAMFCIVIYHLLLHYVIPMKGEDSVFFALQMPLHIGVPLFVFISGHFGIKPSIRGGGKLLLMTAVYFLPLQLFHDVSLGEGFRQILRDVLVISHGPYWFVRTYLLFYLFVPIVNTFMEHVDMRRRVCALAALAVINFWFGAVAQGDSSLLDGKNIVNFTFLYMLGNMIRCRDGVLGRLNAVYYVIAFVTLNVFLVALCFSSNHLVQYYIMRMAFGYNSPLLLLNALLLFLAFSKLQFKSNVVNWLASSVFAVYLITEHPVVINGVLLCGAKWLMASFESSIALCGGLMVFSVSIMTLAICIDKSLSPVWRLAGMLPKSH